eukprot:scaffold20374_cov78-Skeletonema_dohrnii-CCMP3373.AAC.1
MRSHPLLTRLLHIGCVVVLILIPEEVLGRRSVPSYTPPSHPISQPSLHSTISSPFSPSPTIDYSASCGASISACFNNPRQVGICKIAECCWILKRGDTAGQRECVLNSSVPSSSPSVTASYEPSGSPSASPSIQPTGKPSSSPSESPTSTPSTSPSAQPTGKPSSSPSVSVSPSTTPSDAPSPTPSAAPSASPSSQPTNMPSSSPSSTPSATP